LPGCHPTAIVCQSSTYYDSVFSQILENGLQWGVIESSVRGLVNYYFVFPRCKFMPDARARIVLGMRVEESSFLFSS
jgi:hypothetical protein